MNVLTFAPVVSRLMTDISPRIQAAMDFFKSKHAGQFRRDGVTPYFDKHLVGVANRVAALTDDEDMIIAAFGHDSKEDQDVTAEELTELFGARVAFLVDELTDRFTKETFPGFNRAKRKQLERERYGAMSRDAALIKIADVTENLNDRDIEDKGFLIMFTKEKELCLPYLARVDDSRNELLYKAAWAELDAAKKELGIS